jgi:hypothetical protein
MLRPFEEDPPAVYRPVPADDIIDALVHIRDLFRRIRPSKERAVRAHERREASIRDLLSNLPRINRHPTLKTVLEIAEACSMTLEGAHRLFGYSLAKIREYDLRLNGGRTHIVESYPFERDLLVDLPLRVAPRETFSGDALLRTLIPEWQTELPIKALEDENWSQPGTFYVHVGTEDSLGSSIPPGAMALVEPIGHDESLHPNPRRIYLLQFGNGYRCSHCVAAGGKLRPFSSGRTYLGREEFLYPGSVRIAGRIRMFAMDLPAPEFPSLHLLPQSEQGADLILPWEHPSRDRLLLTKRKRFKRSKEQDRFIHDILEAELQARLSGRSERRYRSPTSSEPHVNALIHLTVAHYARYSDSLRAGGSLRSDKGRFSLESLLNARRIEDLLDRPRSARPPTPGDVWDELRREWVEWPPLLSMKFPQLRQWDERIVRLAEGCAIGGLDPSIRPGSCVLLENAAAIPDMRSEVTRTGWSRPLYVLRKGMKLLCGYLDRESNRYVLLSNADGEAKIAFGADELSSLNRVAGIAVPV